jgi:hypothetical protein
MIDTKYDSTADTLLHIKRVNELLLRFSKDLMDRAACHDASKLQEPEKSEFDRLTPILKNLEYGSPEYKESLDELNVALQHHYDNNSHHPQYYDRWDCAMCKREKKTSETWVAKDTGTRFCLDCSGGHAIYETELTAIDFIPGINGMDLLDIVELFMDWKAATERTKGGSIDKSIDINKNRFHLSDQLVSIFKNTVRNYGWNQENNK